MRLRYSPKFKTSFRNFPKETREKFYKQAEYLLRDPRHPSLRAKRYHASRGAWQARVDGRIRFYFLIQGDAYVLLDISKHPK